MSKLTIVAQDDAHPNVDILLGDFFENEMPRDWPAFKAPAPMREKRAAPAWARNSGRLALAACVALMVAGYLTLAGYFPMGPSQSGVIDQARPIGTAEKKGTLPGANDDEPMLPLENAPSNSKSP